MKTNKLLIRLLVRLMKKYHLYDTFTLGLTENKIINHFNDYKNKETSYIEVITCFEVINEASSIRLDYQKYSLICQDLNKILFILLYDDIINFFKKKNIFELFNYTIKKFNSENYKNFDEYIEFFKKKKFDIRILITYAFLFKNTREGYDFWANIHNQYVIYINDLLIK